MLVSNTDIKYFVLLCFLKHLCKVVLISSVFDRVHQGNHVITGFHYINLLKL